MASSWSWNLTLSTSSGSMTSLVTPPEMAPATALSLNHSIMRLLHPHGFYTIYSRCMCPTHFIPGKVGRGMVMAATGIISSRDTAGGHAHRKRKKNVWRARRARTVRYKASCSSWSRRRVELRLFVAVLLRINFDREHYMNQSWDARRLRWAKSHDKLDH